MTIVIDMGAWWIESFFHDFGTIAAGAVGTITFTPSRGGILIGITQCLGTDGGSTDSHFVYLVTRNNGQDTSIGSDIDIVNGYQTVVVNDGATGRPIVAHVMLFCRKKGLR